MQALENDELFDDNADMTDAPHLDEEMIDDDGGPAMSLLDIEREYDVDEADITEEIDLDLLAPADDGYDAEYA